MNLSGFVMLLVFHCSVSFERVSLISAHCVMKTESNLLSLLMGCEMWIKVLLKPVIASPLSVDADQYQPFSPQEMKMFHH